MVQPKPLDGYDWEEAKRGTIRESYRCRRFPEIRDIVDRHSDELGEEEAAGN